MLRQALNDSRRCGSLQLKVSTGNHFHYVSHSRRYPLNIGGLPVKSTKHIINPNTKLCAMLRAPSGFGKTTCAATVDKMCQRFYQKRALIIAVESADGGGVSSIQQYDVPFVTPENIQQLDAVISGLQTDTEFGAVILDNATDMVARILKPHALTFPVRGTPPPTRATGVACRDDYQVMGELMRQRLNSLIKLTKLDNLNARKHLLVTALQKDKYEDDRLIKIHPDLPGAMQDASPAMFELVASIVIKNKVVPDPKNPKATVREQTRLLLTKGDGIQVLKDRYNIFPEEAPLDFDLLWEKYWMPKIAELAATA